MDIGTVIDRVRTGNLKTLDVPFCSPAHLRPVVKRIRWAGACEGLATDEAAMRGQLTQGESGASSFEEL